MNWPASSWSWARVFQGHGISRANPSASDPAKGRSRSMLIAVQPDTGRVDRILEGKTSLRHWKLACEISDTTNSPAHTIRVGHTRWPLDKNTRHLSLQTCLPIYFLSRSVNLADLS